MTDTPTLPTLRTFLIPAGARQGTFRADVLQFLGVTPSADGAVIAALCAEPAQKTPTSGLVNASGQLLNIAKDAPEWSIFVATDGEQPPSEAGFVGFVVARQPSGLAGIFIFARRAVAVEQQEVKE